MDIKHTLLLLVIMLVDTALARPSRYRSYRYKGYTTTFSPTDYNFLIREADRAPASPPYMEDMFLNDLFDDYMESKSSPKQPKKTISLMGLDNVNTAASDLELIRQQARHRPRHDTSPLRATYVKPKSQSRTTLREPSVIAPEMAQTILDILKAAAAAQSS